MKSTRLLFAVMLAALGFGLIPTAHAGWGDLLKDAKQAAGMGGGLSERKISNGLKEALFTPFPDSSLWGSSYCHIDAVVNPCLTYLDGDGVMRRSIPLRIIAFLSRRVTYFVRQRNAFKIARVAFFMSQCHIIKLKDVS